MDEKVNIISVRIDDLNGGQDLLRVQLLLKRMQPQRYVLTSENGSQTGKLHYHIYAEHKYSVKSVRNKFMYLFKETHKGSSYSIAKARNAENLLSYVLKDTKVISKLNYTDEELRQVKKWKPMSGNGLLQTLFGKISSSNLREIISQILEYFDEQSKPIQVHMVRSYAYSVFYRNNGREGKRDMINIIYGY